MPLAVFANVGVAGVGVGGGGEEGVDVGIGIQDTVICQTIYEQAAAKGLGLGVAFS